MRQYGSHNGEPLNEREDPKKCIAETTMLGEWFHQCQNQKGWGPNGDYCLIHADRLKNGMRVRVPKDI